MLCLIDPWTEHLDELTKLTLAHASKRLAVRPVGVPESFLYDANHLNENGSLGAWIPPEPSAKRQAIEAMKSTASAEPVAEVEQPAEIAPEQAVDLVSKSTLW